MKDNELPWTIALDAPLQAVLDDPACPPLVAQALAGVLAWQTRNETTVRRALTATRIAPQFVAALLALGATVTFDGEDAPAELSLDALLRDRRVREASLVRVRVSDEMRWGEARVARPDRRADRGRLRSGRMGERDGARGARGAYRRLARAGPPGGRACPAGGRPAGRGTHRGVSGGRACEVAPRGDFRGSEAYRRAMAGVVARRALSACLR